MLEPIPEAAETPRPQGLGAAPGLYYRDAPVHAGRCCRSGCEARAVFSCGYHDGTGQTCKAEVCAAHLGGLLDGTPLCGRHFGVAEALRRAGFDHHRPDVDDRRFSLLLTVHDDLSEGVIALLGRDRHPDEGVASDRLPTPVRRGAEVAWECGWSSYSNAGNLHRVSLRVTASEPTCVHLLVDQAPVIDAVPYWITRRLQQAPADPRDHAMFAEHLLRAAAAALEAKARPAWLPA